MKNRTIVVYCASVLATACNNGIDKDPGTDPAAPVDTVDIEGEFRLHGTKGQWTRCADGKVFDVPLDGPTLLAERYRAAAGHAGAAVKVWMKAAWRPDSSLRFLGLTHLDPAGRCAPLPQAPLAGHYLLSLAAMATDDRKVELDLFASGLAVQYSTYRDGPVREEFGTWGLDTDGVLRLQWPQRSANLAFAVIGDSLRQMNARTSDVVPVFVANGPVDPSKGTLGKVMQLFDGQTDPPALFSDLHHYFPSDTALSRLGDSVASRHHMSAELRERRWSSVSTLLDLLELVRTLER